MKTIQAKTTKKGQTTIPVEVRRRLGLSGPGPYVWIIDGDDIRVEPAAFTLETAFASLPFELKTEEIDQAIAEATEEQAAHWAGKLESS